MFEIQKQKEGVRGSFVRLVKLSSEDYTVIVRSPDDGRLLNRYMGPDLSKAEEVFVSEVEKLY
ncbi:MAG: hypothetical protein AB7V04_12305 [Desulfomonilaceae bacterium]|mgnify:CR=1 FL=1|nr:hypothetical protein [Syntrophaceae bacterium]